jgi:hypothetical protein
VRRQGHGIPPVSWNREKASKCCRISAIGRDPFVFLDRRSCHDHSLAGDTLENRHDVVFHLVGGLKNLSANVIAVAPAESASVWPDIPAAVRPGVM